MNENIGDDHLRDSNGVLALSDALKRNSALTTLDLQNNSIEDDGAQALGEALKLNSTARSPVVL
ncbi:hypothetical protein MVEG_01229 [Podila verticillata NRRL 6337]|nr:hypothetical protein MVEG_01229 [Podila verticillata NRRL 6337]